MINNYFSKFRFLIVGFLVLVGVWLLGFGVRAYAGEVVGYAWSENIGWLKFDGPTYGVSINDASGDFSGYAWSEGIGWVDFSGVRLNLSTNQVIGQANVASWNGPIKFSGSQYGVNRVVDMNNGCTLEGWAWGSDVVGWVRFGGPTYRVSTTLCPVDVNIEPPPPTDINCSFSANPALLIHPRNQSTLTWSCQGADTCAISHLGNVDANEGSKRITVSATSRYTLNCGNADGSSFSKTVEVKVLRPVYCEIIPQGPGC